MSMKLTSVTNESFLRLSEIKRRVGLNRTTIYSMAARGEFPKPIKVGERASGWLASEIDAWMRQRIAASRPER